MRPVWQRLADIPQLLPGILLVLDSDATACSAAFFVAKKVICCAIFNSPGYVVDLAFYIDFSITPCLGDGGSSVTEHIDNLWVIRVGNVAIDTQE